VLLRRGRFVRVLLIAVPAVAVLFSGVLYLFGAPGPDARVSRAMANSPQTGSGESHESCTEVGLAPFPTLSGRVLIASEGGDSSPRLIIRWRPQALPTACVRAGLHRTVSVQVRLKTSGSHGLIPIGRGHGRRQWLTVDRSPNREGLQRAVGLGLIFAEPLGCIEKVVGLARYRLTNSDRSVHAQRIVKFVPEFEACDK
jgi:hypothetical protein